MGYRLEGALAAGSAGAGPGPALGGAAGADRSAGRVPGDTDRGPSTRSYISTRSLRGYARAWRRELAVLRQTLAAVDGPQLVAGDFNAARDHRPFRELLAAGLVDCADVSQNRSWPGFTWPAEGRALPVMRLDHVLVSRTATVRMTRAIRVPRTDHRGVLAAVEFTPKT